MGVKGEAMLMVLKMGSCYNNNNTWLWTSFLKHKAETVIGAMHWVCFWMKNIQPQLTFVPVEQMSHHRFVSSPISRPPVQCAVVWPAEYRLKKRHVVCPGGSGSFPIIILDFTKLPSLHLQKVTSCMTAANLHVSQDAPLAVSQRINYSLFLHHSALKYLSLWPNDLAISFLSLISWAALPFSTSKRQPSMQSQPALACFGSMLAVSVVSAGTELLLWGFFLAALVVGLKNQAPMESWMSEIKHRRCWSSVSFDCILFSYALDVCRSMQCGVESYVQIAR